MSFYQPDASNAPAPCLHKIYKEAIAGGKLDPKDFMFPVVSDITKGIQSLATSIIGDDGRHHGFRTQKVHNLTDDMCMRMVKTDTALKNSENRA